MKRLDRYYFAGLATATAGDRVALDAREGGHALRVKRNRVGSDVELFDGAGRVARATISGSDRRGAVEASIVAVESVAAPRDAVHLAIAVPRGDRMETLIDMATQIGVTRLSPLLFERSAPRAGTDRRDRWERVVIEACKQCGRDYAMPIDAMCTLFDWLAGLHGAPAAIRWLADPTGVRPAQLPVPAKRRTCLVLIGPEGGLTPGELDAVNTAGFTPVCLADHVLRIETAAIAAASAALLLG